MCSTREAGDSLAAMKAHPHLTPHTHTHTHTQRPNASRRVLREENCLAMMILVFYLALMSKPQATQGDVYKSGLMHAE